MESQGYIPFPCKRCCDFHRFSGVLAALWAIISVFHLGGLRWSADFAWGWRRQCWQAKQEQNLVVAQNISKFKRGCPGAEEVQLFLHWELLKFIAVVDLKILTKLICYSYLCLSYKLIVMICKCKWNCLYIHINKSFVGHSYIRGTVYLNQLMAFAAVTAPALLAVKNTAAFVSLEQQLRSLRQLITFVSAPVQAGHPPVDLHFLCVSCIWTVLWYRSVCDVLIAMHRFLLYVRCNDSAMIWSCHVCTCLS